MMIDAWICFFFAVLFYPQAFETALFQNCKPYSVIPESKYDKDASSASNPAKHPNGFWYGLAVYPGTSTNLKNPCVIMTNITDRSVEVMVQTFNDDKICVRDDGGNTECGTGTISKCFPAHADTVKFEFYCDPGKGCDSDVQFWYRLIPSVGDVDNWCTILRGGNDFPKSLFLMPSEIAPKPAITSSVAKLSSTGLISLLVLLLLSHSMQEAEYVMFDQIQNSPWELKDL